MDGECASCSWLKGYPVPGCPVHGLDSGQDKTRRDESRARRDVVKRDPLCDKLLAATG